MNSRNETNQRWQISYRQTMLIVATCLLLSGCQSWLSNRIAIKDDVAPITITTDEPSNSKSPGKVVQASATIPPKAPSEVIQTSSFGPPPGMSVSPWGTTYIAPGEPSCSPEQLPVYDTIFPAPGMIVPNQMPFYGMTPSTSPFGAPPQTQGDSPGRAGWLDVLPQEGGAISPDFGLPREAVVANRVANPLYLRSNNPEATWEALADELTKYFPIQTEQRIEQAAGVLTEGRFETPWQVSATVLEPWKNDSVGSFNRWQSTWQTVRRKAVVRVIPAAGGYEIEARVEKQLEDLPRPERASAGAASFRSDTALPTDRLNPIDPIRTTDRWISIGRDEPLEQELLRRFRGRLAGSP